jgi:hypothetical protein
LEANYGTETVTDITIVVDGGWISPKGQDITVDNFTVDNKVMHASSTTFQ